ncbi:ATP-dependent RNA helicase HrpA [bacterium]|nr:ATP-dependent RNA helicase HrpA [bacterium]
MPFDKRTLRGEIERVLCKDRYRLIRQLQHLPSVDEKNFSSQLDRFKRNLKLSQQRVEARKNSIPSFKYPSELPISSKHSEICDTIRKNQVIVITGETGSGKTTQIPKMCLDAGRGIFGKIACTQPRRIAATSLSLQVAKELNSEVGDLVGYRIRFADKTQESTLIQFVTDGLLLAEIQGDRFLNQYDTIIVDEAHERTLNIDFILGYLNQLLRKRSDLKLIITSATIDVDKFSAAFPLQYNETLKENLICTKNKNHLIGEPHGAPIVKVSGRMYPVELRYLPIDEVKEEQGDITIIDLVIEAVEEILTETTHGDILVFMSGIQEIREALDRFSHLTAEGFLVLPLFSRLSRGEQNRIFQSTHHRKIILSTNIAETSITVPGIRYVVDTGRARISQYNSRSGTQGLPIVAISQSSADQRKGRCGRVSDGICIRLYSEEDYDNRFKYTIPEIQRSNLSEVILRLLDLKLGDIETFPFIDPPQSAQIRAGFRTLRELGALDERRKITSIGKELAFLPVDPRTARMILQANREKSLYAVLIIASAISCQDPRERPEDKKTQADQKHALFKSRESDLITLLNLWEEYHSTLEDLKTQGKMRKFCKANFLSYNRIREWRDIHSQLTSIAIDKNWNVNKPDSWDYDGIHQSILAGYLTHIAKKKEKKIYQGTKNRELTLFPGSDQYQSRHEWIVAIELIETSKLFAHRVAKINPDWLESLANNLCKKSWAEPHWEKESGRVFALEKVTLFGFILVENRKVFYGKIDREEANRVFVREALVQGNFESNLPFWKHNQNLIKEIETEEAKIRSKMLLVEDEVIEDFYLQRITGVACLDDMKKLIKSHSGDKFLFMTKEDLLRNEHDANSNLFPGLLNIGGTECPLHYEFEPGHPKDGITIHIPWPVLSSVREEVFEYLVPGLLKEKIVWLLKNLPKEERRKIVPIPEKAEKIWDEMTSLSYSTQEKETGFVLKDNFYTELSEALFRVARVDISPESWDRDSLPDYLRMNFAVTKPKSSEVTYSRNLDELKNTKTAKAKDNWKQIISPFERWGICTWDFGTLMEKMQLSVGGDIEIWGFKTLEIKDSELHLTVCKTYEEALERSLGALPKLIESQLGDELAWLYDELRFPPETLHRLQNLWQSNREISIEALSKKFNSLKPKHRTEYHSRVQQRAYQMVYDGLCGYNGTPLLTEKSFYAYVKTINLNDLGAKVTEWINQTLETYHQVLSFLLVKQVYLDRNFVNSIHNELRFFLSQDCLEEIPLEQWKHCPRILRCYKKRIERCLEDPSAENERFQIVRPYQEKMEGLKETKNSTIQANWSYQRVRWMLEELKVSIFAQGLSTAFPISKKRLDKFLSDFFN